MPALYEPRATFFVLLDLGGKPAAPRRPADLFDPLLTARLADSEVADVRLRSGRDELHMEVRAAGIEYHFHPDGGDGSTSSPWPPEVTEGIVRWISATAIEYWQRALLLEHHSAKAADAYMRGDVLYVADDELARQGALDTLAVNVPAVDPATPSSGAGTDALIGAVVRQAIIDAAVARMAGLTTGD